MCGHANDENIEDVADFLSCSYSQITHYQASCHIDEEMCPQPSHLDPDVWQSDIKPNIIEISVESAIWVPFDKVAKPHRKGNTCAYVSWKPKVLDVMVGDHQWENAGEEPIEPDGLSEGQKVLLNDTFRDAAYKHAAEQVHYRDRIIEE